MNARNPFSVSSHRMADIPGGTSLEARSDEQLVSLSQGGDLQAFNDLAARWEAEIFRFLRRSLGNTEDARDLCQETLVKAYLNIAKLRDVNKFRSWIYNIALNLCRDRFRTRRARTPSREFLETGPDEMRLAVERAPGVAPDAAAIRNDMVRHLEEVLQEIPEEQRHAILLREYQGLTSEEIGEVMGVPAATVRTRIFYGLKALRARMGDRGILGEEIS